MATKFPLGKARELYKALGELHQTLGAALASIDTSGEGKDHNPNKTVAENVEQNVKRRDNPEEGSKLAGDADPLGINRLSRARNGSGLTAEMLNRLSRR